MVQDILFLHYQPCSLAKEWENRVGCVQVLQQTDIKVYYDELVWWTCPIWYQNLLLESFITVNYSFLYWEKATWRRTQQDLDSGRKLNWNQILSWWVSYWTWDTRVIFTLVSLNQRQSSTSHELEVSLHSMITWACSIETLITMIWPLLKHQYCHDDTAIGRTAINVNCVSQ